MPDLSIGDAHTYPSIVRNMRYVQTMIYSLVPTGNDTDSRSALAKFVSGLLVTDDFETCL